jgi:predicted NAD/FAD-binding protein
MKIAIIGTGIAGNVVAYKLRQEHDITVFESGAYVGGHTNTVDVYENGRKLAVDTGFIVFNDRTYPNFMTR